MKKVFKLDVSAMTIFVFVFIESRLTIEAFTSLIITFFVIINASFVIQVESTLTNFIFDIIKTLSNSIN